MKWFVDSMIRGEGIDPSLIEKRLGRLYKKFPDVPEGTLGELGILGEVSVPRGAPKYDPGIKELIPLALLEDKRHEGPILDIHLNEEMLDERKKYQIPLVDQVMLHDEGVVVGPTGSGKTVILCMVAARRQRRTLIICQATKIAEQIKGAVEKFLGIPAGFIGGGERDIRPVTVGLIQSIDPDDPILQEIGVLMIDEGHHVSAPSYLKILAACPARYRYAFTATIQKRNHEQEVIFAAIGPVVAELDVKDLQADNFVNKGYVIPVFTTAVATKMDYVSKRCWNYKKVEKARGEGMEACCPEPCTYHDDGEIKDCVFSKGYFPWLYGVLSNDVLRNKRIVEVTERALKKHPWTVLLTHLKKHAVKLHKQFLEAGIKSHIAIGNPDMKKKERDVAFAKYKDEGGVLISTSSLIGEGFDAPKTSCLIRAMPSGGKVAIKQQTGRIMRPQEKKSLVLDLVDEKVDPLKYWWRSRLRIYEEIGFKIQYLDIQ